MTAPAEIQRQISAVKVQVGDTVIIHGLTGRPELNGQEAKILGADKNDDGRVRVEIKKIGETVSVSKRNLFAEKKEAASNEAATNEASQQSLKKWLEDVLIKAMPQVEETMLLAIQAALQQGFQALGIKDTLPTGALEFLSVGIAAVAAIIALSALTGVVSTRVMPVLAVASFTTRQKAGQALVQQCSAKVYKKLALGESGTQNEDDEQVGKHVHERYIVLALCLIVALVGHLLPFGKPGAPFAKTVALQSAVREAYQGLEVPFQNAIREAYLEGHADGVARKEPRPPNYLSQDFSKVSNTSPSFGSRFLMKSGAAAYYVYIKGKKVNWDTSEMMKGLLSEPVQAAILLVMFSMF